jgi:hypothetical protein
MSLVARARARVGIQYLLGSQGKGWRGTLGVVNTKFRICESGWDAAHFQGDLPDGFEQGPRSGGGCNPHISMQSLQ